MPRTARTLTITVRADIQRFSQNRSARTWRVVHGRMQQAKELGRAAWMQAGQPRANGRVRVSMLIRRGRVIDQQNAWGAAKGLMDGIFKDGVTPDDGERYVELGSIRQETGKQWKGREEVVFEIEEVV